MVEVDELWRYSGVAAESNGRTGGAVRHRHRRRIARSHEDVFRASKLDRAGTKFAIEATEGFRTRSRDLDLSGQTHLTRPWEGTRSCVWQDWLGISPGCDDRVDLLKTVVTCPPNKLL